MTQKLQLLQVLRGVTAFIVVVYHLSSFTKHYFNDQFINVDWGWAGVDVFFVLSGFIITLIHFDDVKNKGNVRSFLKKRFVRVYPIYWIVLILSIFVYLFGVKGAASAQVNSHLNLLSLDGWQYLFSNYLLMPAPTFYIVGPAWSLTYEILFYFIFALCIKLGFNFLKALVPVWITLIILNITHVIQLPKGFPQVMLNVVILEFLMGCFIAYLFKYKSHVLKLSYLLVGVMIVGVGCYYYFVVLDYRFWRKELMPVLLIGSFSSFIVLILSIIDKRFNVKLPNLPVLIGDSSYSIYLIHPIVLSASCRAALIFIDQFNLHVSKDLIFLCVLIITLVVGILFHFFIERPLLSILRNWQFSTTKVGSFVAKII